MGVPKFFRWASQRYPAILSAPIAKDDGDSVPDVDNLYLDMNGVIHRFSHPNSEIGKEKDINVVIDEICEYVDNLVTVIVKPLQLLFVAVDGVAPRAKLNQQRSRRFRSADEMKLAIKKLQDRGEEVEEHFFDSNCISPGTQFMEQVSRGLKAFILRRMQENEIWGRLQIYFSGHDVPGEGEHKIVSFIRNQRIRPDFLPNQRHCMNGQDADMIMLSLITHEPFFLILREVLEFGSSSKTASSTAPLRFELVRIHILREYLIRELSEGISNDSAEGEGDEFGEETIHPHHPPTHHHSPPQPHHLDPERLIDDFVFMTFLVGNDFLPTLPSLHIGDGAFDLLFDHYKTLLLTDYDYIVEDGQLKNLTSFQILCTYLSHGEEEILRERAKKAVGWAQRNGFPPEPLVPTGYLQAVQYAINSDDIQEADWDAVLMSSDPSQPLPDHRRLYYYKKFGFLIDTPQGKDKLREIVHTYFEGILWNFAYYSKGCVSWSWFYPYHYGPLVQDLVTHLPTFFSTSVHFTLDQPLKPFQQLLACLPPFSSSLLPPLYRPLMIDSTSPVLEYYPTKIVLDLNWEEKAWKAVVVLPFIDTSKLFEAIEQYCLHGEKEEDLLSEEERARNRFSHTHLYVATPLSTSSPSSVEIDSSFPPSPPPPTSHASHSRRIQETLVDLETQGFEGSAFKPQILMGTASELEGYTSLFHLSEEEVQRIQNHSHSNNDGGGGGGERGRGKGKNKKGERGGEIEKEIVVHGKGGGRKKPS